MVRKNNNYRLYKEIALQFLGNKCSKCGSTTRLEIDHKDGNPTNSHIDNIDLLCKGCHIKKHIPKFDLFKYREEKKELKLLKNRCRYCNQEFSSLYQKQLDYNHRVHEMSCEIKRGETK